MGLISGIAHVNLTIPPGTLDQAAAFYADTLGFTQVAVPVLQKDSLAWFDITPHGQQMHISTNGPPNEPNSSRHPCFKLESIEALNELRQRVWTHYEKGGDGKPLQADKPGEVDSGAKGVEYPTRFFARDFAGNRLEFSV